MFSSSSEKKQQLKGYNSVPTVEASTVLLEDPNVSWVQAYAVQLPKKSSAMETDTAEGWNNDAAAPEPLYQDVPFAITFWAHMAIMVFVAIFYGSFNMNLNYSHDESSEFNFNSSTSQTWIVALAVIIATSMLLPSFLIGRVVPSYPQATVTASLYLSVLCTLSMTFMLLVAFPSFWTFLIMVALTLYFAWYVNTMRMFIPYAAALLKIACEGVAQNWGIYIVSGISSVAGILWTVMWFYVANGVGMFDDPSSQNSSQKVDDNYYYGEDVEIGIKAFALLISLYWTINVIMNLTQTTVAGMIGTYCFDKASASSFLSFAVQNSLKRSCTTSFGSVCFGSLLNAIITALRVLADSSRENSRNDGNGGAELLYCIIQCILSLVEDIMEYFNQWSYVFVGIHGMSYLESGKAVIEMFKARGCSAILTNGLAIYVINAVVLLSGIACGIIGVAVSLLDTRTPWLPAFW